MLKSTKITHYPQRGLLLLLMLPLFSTIAIYGFLFPFYQTNMRKDFTLGLQEGVNIPPQAECEKFLKIEEISSTDADLNAQLENGREFITKRTFLNTKVPVLKNNTVTTKYQVYLDSRVQAEDEVKVMVQNSFKYYLNDKPINKYINLNYVWENNDQTLITGKTNPNSKTLFLTVTYQIDYEALKNDGIIKDYLNKNQPVLKLGAEFGIQTIE